MCICLCGEKIFICGEIGSLVVSKIPTNCGDFDLWEIVCGDLTNGPFYELSPHALPGTDSF